MVIGQFKQSDLLGVLPKARPGYDKNPAKHIPYLQQFDLRSVAYAPFEISWLAGSVSRSLAISLGMIAGTLSASVPFLNSVTETITGEQIAPRLIRDALGYDDVFEASNLVTVLRSDGQTYEAPLYRVTPTENANVLSSMVSFVEAFRGVSPESLSTWGLITGLRTIDPNNTVRAIEIIKEFGKNPDAPQFVHSEDTNSGNSKRGPVRKMEAAGYIGSDTRMPRFIEGSDGSLLPAKLIYVPTKMQDTAFEFGQRISAYEQNQEQHLQHGFGNLFDIQIGPDTQNMQFGISPQRYELIAESLYMYQVLSETSLRNKNA